MKALSVADMKRVVQSQKTGFKPAVSMNLSMK